MNFRDLSIMNDTLLSKQFWRLMENPSSLVIRILKSKYFSTTDVLHSSLQQTSSSVWRAIWKAGMEVKQWISYNQNMEPKWMGDPTGFFSVKSIYLSLKQKYDEKHLNDMRECSDKSTMMKF